VDLIGQTFELDLARVDGQLPEEVPEDADGAD
jgi:hypothetical protein